MKKKNLIIFAYAVRDSVCSQGYQCATLLGGKEVSVGFPVTGGFFEVKITEEIANLPIEKVANSIIEQMKKIN